MISRFSSSVFLSYSSLSCPSISDFFFSAFSMSERTF